MLIPTDSVKSQLEKYNLIPPQGKIIQNNDGVFNEREYSEAEVLKEMYVKLIRDSFTYSVQQKNSVFCSH